MREEKQWMRRGWGRIIDGKEQMKEGNVRMRAVKELMRELKDE